MFRLYWGVFVFVLSAGLTFVARWISQQRELFDRPGERSSHSVPTPRLGGIGLAIGTLCGWLALPGRPDPAAQVAIPLQLGGLTAALVGLVDDLRGLSPSLKLGGQAVAVAITLSLFPFSAEGWVRLAAIAVAAVWVLAYMNFFNFMDGADGLAGGVAIAAASGLALLASRLGVDVISWLAIAIVLSAAGFLIFNFPPASIFMGDGGSMFLGFGLGSLALSLAVTTTDAVAPILVLSPFLFDASVTLMVRAFRGEVLWQAHRSHLYQRLLRTGTSHLSVAAIYTGWTVVMCGLAWTWVAEGRHWRPWILLSACIPGPALVLHVWRSERAAARRIDFTT